MKLLAIVAAGGFVFGGTTLSSAAGSHGASRSLHASQMGLSVSIPGIRGFAPRHFFIPMQTGSTGATATDTAAATATPGPTATPEPTQVVGCSSCPDASSLVNSMINKLALIKTLKFKEITDAQQPGIETAHIQATGVATCSGPALYGHVTGVDTVQGTSQTTKLKYSVIEVKSKYFAKSSASKNKWKAVKNPTNLPFVPDTGAILLCSTGGSSSGGSGGSGSADQCQVKDLVNLGAGSVSGTSTWKLQATEVCISGTTTQEATLGFEIAQKNYLLLVESVSVTDPTQNIQENFRRERSNFGLKVTVKKPQIGSNKPK